MDDLEKYIEDASKLALLDAAYFLWRLCDGPTRLKDPMHDWPKRPREKKLDLSDAASFSRHLPELIRGAFAEIRFREANADIGPVFHWLKRAHPSVESDLIRESIRSAVNFDRDCIKYFKYSSGSLFADAKSAIDKAAQLNPGFGEETISSAIDWTCLAMR